MMNNFFFILLFLVSNVFFTNAQEAQVPIYSFEEFEPVLKHNNDTIYVINFWATRCKPCIEELPYFEQLNNSYSTQKVKVILVSLDFADELNTRLIPFIQRKNIKSTVILLNEPDPNTFIDKININWSGAIPATIVYKGNESDFYEKSFNYQELISVVEQKIEK